MSPDGGEFEVLGRAGPVERTAAPYVMAEAREDLLVAKHGDLFLCVRPDGEISPGRISGEGLYAHDTRYLSELRLTIGGKPPVLLSSSADTGSSAHVHATNAELRDGDRVLFPHQNLQVERHLLVADRLYASFTLSNFGRETLASTLTLLLSADFADMFEVRGTRSRGHRGHALAPKRTGRRVRLAYMGEDGQFREAVLGFDPEPAAPLLVEPTRVVARWPLELPPHGTDRFLLTVEAGGDGARRGRGTARAEAEIRRQRQEWEAAATRIETDNPAVERVLHASSRDLHALTTPLPGEPAGGARYLAAGIPWYVALFGRDSLITCYESLLLNPRLARETLQVLARHQAVVDDPWRDAEPGKILHELRCGELAGAGLVPHTPYYGTVDATPLFLMLAAAYWRWTADLETLRVLRPALDAALGWIDGPGDPDGDGFVEYRRRSAGGLLNQGWKDSEDSMVHADGSMAEGPLALVEVQGYVYFAKVRIAEVYDALGAHGIGQRLRAEAARLKEAFNDVFWDPQEGSFVLALDGGKRPVRSVTSNPAHCLYCEIVEPAKARALADRLTAPDMLCGWGLRTLSAASPAYNPMSYHNGSIWPHDNAVAAAGLKRYGFWREAERIATALFDVATATEDSRLPELYCGFERGSARLPVSYPVACIPQAWAAAAPFMLLQAMLGISARAPEGVLTVNEPRLPNWLGEVRLHGIRVGDASVGLAFNRTGGHTAFARMGPSDAVRVVMTG
jgi:glycogen debranching enzyme